MHNPGVYTSVTDLLNLRHLASGLALVARKQSNALAEGNVKTRYRGRGMEFAEVRPYQAGDDIRTIDWRVTARMQAPYTKLFQEEHERPVFVMVDQRSPMFFGSKTAFKSVYAAQLAAAVGWIAQANNDRVGALVFGDTTQNDIRPRRGKHAVLDLINQLVNYNQKLTAPNLTSGSNTLLEMLKDTARVAKPGSMVVLISDFLDFNEQCNEHLAHMAKRSDVLGVHLYDALERDFPAGGQFTLSDSFTQMTVDAKKIRQSFNSAFEQGKQHLRGAMLNCGVQYVDAPLDIELDTFVRDVFNRKKGIANKANANTRGAR